VELEFFKKVPFFAGIAPEEISAINEIIIYRKYKKDMIIFLEDEPGEAMFFVKEGKVKISKQSQDGREQILHLLKNGDIFAEVVMMEYSTYPATAQVLEDTTVGMLRKNDFFNFIQKQPKISLNLLKIMSKKMRNAFDLMSDLASKNTNSRVARLLLTLAKDHGEKNQTGYVIDLPVSRTEMANMIGTSRETVTRALSQIKQEGFIEIKKNKIYILDEEALEEWG
jgi:CRP/FNR family transcriptional regulator, cyclic AMP receptor protein